MAAEDYGADGVVLTLELPVARFEALQALLVDLSRGQVRLQRRGQRRQAVGGTRGIAGRVGLAVGPGRLELAAGPRALLV
ncbi:DUF1949 domain-containing protein, partial [Acinetobacter baumannii]